MCEGKWRLDVASLARLDSNSLQTKWGMIIKTQTIWHYIWINDYIAYSIYENLFHRFCTWYILEPNVYDKICFNFKYVSFELSVKTTIHISFQKICLHQGRNIKKRQCIPYNLHNHESRSFQNSIPCFISSFATSVEGVHYNKRSLHMRCHEILNTLLVFLGSRICSVTWHAYTSIGPDRWRGGVM